MSMTYLPASDPVGKESIRRHCPRRVHSCAGEALEPESVSLAVLSAGSKIPLPAPASCWVELNSERFDAVAGASELPDHSRSACSLQPFADGLAAFLVADPSVQDDPDQPTKPMGNCPNGLIVSQAQYEAAIHDLEDASFRPDRSVGALIENAPHLAVALGGAVARGDSRALLISRARSHPGRQGLLPSKRRGLRPLFGDDLVCRNHSH